MISRATFGFALLCFSLITFSGEEGLSHTSRRQIGGTETRKLEIKTYSDFQIALFKNGERESENSLEHSVPQASDSKNTAFFPIYASLNGADFEFDFGRFHSPLETVRLLI